MSQPSLPLAMTISLGFSLQIISTTNIIITDNCHDIKALFSNVEFLVSGGTKCVSHPLYHLVMTMALSFSTQSIPTTTLIIIINNCHDILLPQHSHTNHTPPTINSFSPSELPFKRQGSYLEGSPPPSTKSSSDVMSTSDRSDNDVRPTKETSNNCFLPSSKVLKPRDNQFVEGKLPPIYQQDVSLG